MVKDTLMMQTTLTYKHFDSKTKSEMSVKETRVKVPIKYIMNSEKKFQ